MLDSINYKHLRYFWVVAREGSIIQASERLNITPQTISGQLSKLEERINTPLFERKGRGLQLTDAGRVVMRYADNIFELGSELSDILRGEPTIGPSEFIISASSAIPKTIVHKIIEPALNIDREVSLTSLEGPVDAILADLAVHKIDMVLSDTPVRGALSIKVDNHKLGESGITFLGTPKLAKKYRKNFPQSLHHAPMLLPTEQNEVRRLFDHFASSEKIHPTVRGQFDDSALMKSFGKAGMGIFFMPSIIAEEVCKTFNVSIIGKTDKIKQEFYAISAQRKISHPAVAAICNSAKQGLFE